MGHPVGRGQRTELDHDTLDHLRPATVKIRRSIAAASVGLMAASIATPAIAGHKARIEGETRYDTAASISGVTFPSSDVAIVTTGTNFPDALAASYLSQALSGAPILLTEPDSLNQATSDELDRLGVETVYIVGREVAVSAAVEAALAGAYDVQRIGGADRYETAQMIAEFDITPDDGSDVGTFGSSGRTAFISTGEKFPDALAAGPLAYSGSFPIILTAADALRDEAVDALENLDIEYVIILGGPVAISEGVESAIKDLGVTTVRIGGETRRDTAVDVANFARTQLGFTQDQVLLATGLKFPDALAAGPYGGRIEASIVLTEEVNQVGTSTLNFLSAQKGAINTVITLGGTDAISEEAETAASSAAE